MQQIADFHIHSRYSRACSRDLNLENIDKTCRVKGVDIIGTGDFTFPDWFRAIEEELEEIPSCKNTPRPGSPGHPSQEGNLEKFPPFQGGVPGGRCGSPLYKLKSADNDKVKFILTTELALVYKDNDRARRVHIVVHAPNLEAVRELNKYLDENFNIRSDGRPILGMSVPELCKLCFSIHPKFLIYPAHIWTPWYSVFGSKSGFDLLEACFHEYTDQIYAYETGLSSDPEMNWRVSALDKLTLLSNSDAHSLPNIAREANVFEFDTVTYDSIYESIKQKKNLKYTLEFYPEEGMYHYDGHRDCGVCFTPAETKKAKGICPVCGKKLVIGVDYRVEELADNRTGRKPEGAPGFKKLVELDKIIAEAVGVKSRKSKKVIQEYNNLTNNLGTELDILLNKNINEIEIIAGNKIALGIKRVREGKLIIKPGFDGQYGEIKIFNSDSEKNKTQSLFD